MPKRRTGGGSRTGAGRKPRPPQTVRSVPILLRVSPVERAALDAAAGDVPLATWLRDVALRAARRRTR